MSCLFAVKDGYSHLFAPASTANKSGNKHLNIHPQGKTRDHLLSIERGGQTKHETTLNF